ncbi:MAG: hypothetical protein AVO39_10140 [delta proteobacterium MLS_D]|nr:MAG: hypothetical protein AVO39_10140 [delta proteobacterium MLS_D]
MGTNTITGAQKTAIWTILRENGIEEEMFRNWLQEHYGKRSTRELSNAQAASVIQSLKAFVGEEYKPRTMTWGITDRQMWAARAIAKRIGWDDPKRLDGMAKRMFTGKFRLELLNKAEGSKLILALERMEDEVKRGERVYA